MKDIELKPLFPEHADSYFTVLEKNREHILPWMPYAASLQNVEETEQYLKEHQDSIFLGIYLRDNLIGNITLYQKNRSYYISYWLDEEYTGKGIVTYGCLCLVIHAFEILKLRRVNILCLEKNKKSADIAKRLLFKKLKRYWCKHNEANVLHYALDRRVWKREWGI